jgi:hypothetical protein
MLAVAALSATAQPPSNRPFFQRWFVQGAERQDGHGDNRGGARAGASRPPPQDVRPQGDLRGDIYNHLREQRQPPPPSPADNPRQRDRGDRSARSR